MLTAMQQLRDQAFNSVVLAQAEIASLRRTLTERDGRIKALETEVATLKNGSAGP